MARDENLVPWQEGQSPIHPTDPTRLHPGFVQSTMDKALKGYGGPGELGTVSNPGSVGPLPHDWMYAAGRAIQNNPLGNFFLGGVGNYLTKTGANQDVSYPELLSASANLAGVGSVARALPAPVGSLFKMETNPFTLQRGAVGNLGPPFGTGPGASMARRAVTEELGGIPKDLTQGDPLGAERLVKRFARTEATRDTTQANRTFGGMPNERFPSTGPIAQNKAPVPATPGGPLTLVAKPGIDFRPGYGPPPEVPPAQIARLGGPPQNPLLPPPEPPLATPVGEAVRTEGGPTSVGVGSGGTERNVVGGRSMVPYRAPPVEGGGPTAPMQPTPGTPEYFQREAWLQGQPTVPVQLPDWFGPAATGAGGAAAMAAARYFGNRPETPTAPSAAGVVVAPAAPGGAPLPGDLMRGVTRQKLGGTEVFRKGNAFSDAANFATLSGGKAAPMPQTAGDQYYKNLGLPSGGESPAEVTAQSQLRYGWDGVPRMEVLGGNRGPGSPTTVVGQQAGPSPADQINSLAARLAEETDPNARSALVHQMAALTQIGAHQMMLNAEMARAQLPWTMGMTPFEREVRAPYMAAHAGYFNAMPEIREEQVANQARNIDSLAAYRNAQQNRVMPYNIPATFGGPEGFTPGGVGWRNMYGPVGAPGQELAPQSFVEGQVKLNPKTGEQIIFRNGKWQPYQTSQQANG